MKFTGNTLGLLSPDERHRAEALLAWVKESTFEHPAHLLDELRRLLAGSAWSAGQHNGILNIHGARGIVLRLRPIE